MGNTNWIRLGQEEISKSDGKGWVEVKGAVGMCEYIQDILYELFKDLWSFNVFLTLMTPK